MNLFKYLPVKIKDSDTFTCISFLLDSLYSSDDRYYHNLNHINSCILLFVDHFHKLNITAYEEIYLAIVFHDAIYNTHDKQNEFNSSILFKSVSGSFDLGLRQINRVSNMIKLTGTHSHNNHQATVDEKVVLDIDLSSLGAENYKDFNRDTDNIRKEYSWVPDELFAQKRIELLKQFLAKDKIYYTELAISLFEENARRNINLDIEKWSKL